MANEPEQKPHGLWAVMRQRGDAPIPQAPPDSPPSESVEEPESIEFEAADPEAEAPSPSPGKGLWAMMGVRPAVAPESSPAEVSRPQEPEPSTEENPVAAPPPAWFRGKTEPEPLSEPEPPQPEEPIEPFQEVPIPEPKLKTRPVPRTEPAPFVVTALETPAQAKLTQLAVKTGRSRGAMLSFLVGLFAIPMTLLAMRPEIWTRIPAACLGFGALVLGLISFNEIQRSHGQQRGTGFAMAGMILGTIAMFLGPLVIAPWSASQTQAGGRRTTQTHLESLGTALGKYHDQYDRFPPGETYRVEETGETTALHGWMTHLLPYLDAQSTYQNIRWEDPWSDAVNKSPMTQKIPAFLAGGVEQTHNRSGYALSHFAGVGGQVRMSDGRYANVGIFDRDSLVKRSDITDGLSQTLVAGEIPGDYRPWGETGNWRTLGDGLNRDAASFGNAERSGAMFLRADGSVRFFSNQVSPDILKRLSTRDGEDNRLIPDKLR